MEESRSSVLERIALAVEFLFCAFQLFEEVLKPGSWFDAFWGVFFVWGFLFVGGFFCVFFFILFGVFCCFHLILGGFGFLFGCLFPKSLCMCISCWKKMHLHFCIVCFKLKFHNWLPCLFTVHSKSFHKELYLGDWFSFHWISGKIKYFKNLFIQCSEWAVLVHWIRYKLSYFTFLIIQCIWRVPD